MGDAAGQLSDELSARRWIILVLDRRLNERIFIGSDIILTVTRIQPDKVKIGITAPRETQIWREELLDKKPAQPVEECKDAS